MHIAVDTLELQSEVQPVEIVIENGTSNGNDRRNKSIDCEQHQHAVILHRVLQSEDITKLINKANLVLEDSNPNQPGNAVKYCQDLCTDSQVSTPVEGPVAELVNILEEPSFKSLLDTHDQIRNRSFYTPPPSPCILPYEDDSPVGEPLRIVGLFKKANEPLGVTLSTDGKGRIFISRIHNGSTIDRQGLLRVGDVIREINGKSPGKTADEVYDYFQNLSGSVTVKVTPMYKENFGLCQMFIKTHFDYDPTADDRLTCQHEGVAFNRNDILEVVDQSDSSWWQARTTDGSERGGVIPSTAAEERRRMKVTPNHKQSKGSIFGGKKSKTKKIMFSASKNAGTFNRLHAPIYEEVALMPPFERKTIVLSGPNRIGKRSLKNKLISVDPARFSTTIPHTSRPPRSDEESGRGYFFVERRDMQRDIDQGKYIEWEEFEGHLYGTKLESLRNVVRSGKICVLDCKATALEMIRTTEFMPLVVFISAPKGDAIKSNKDAIKSNVQRNLTESELSCMVQESEELQRLYSHYFDLVLVNNDLAATYDRLKEAMEEFSSKPQWVPVEWIY